MYLLQSRNATVTPKIGSRRRVGNGEKYQVFGNYYKFQRKQKSCKQESGKKLASLVEFRGADSR